MAIAASNLGGNSLFARAVAVGAALIIDRVTPEPSNQWHPVAWFGSAMTKVEQRVWADDRTRGVIYTGLGLTVGALAGSLVRSTGLATLISLGAGSLRTTALQIGEHLEGGDLHAARAALPALVGRDPSELDEAGIASAVVESVAENTVDAVVAPMFWALTFGAPGALGYRAINTMDAMVGHRSERFEQFGWASARLDDLANYLPARLFGLSVLIVRTRRSAAIVHAVSKDAPLHPSPNAGVAEAAVAGALDVQLGGTLHYGERIEHRPLLGTGSRPDASTIRETVDLVDRAQFALATAALLAGILTRTRKA